MQSVAIPFCLILNFFMMDNFLFEEKTYAIIGLCMEIHRIPSHGFSEIVYKDALMFRSKIE